MVVNDKIYNYHYFISWMNLNFDHFPKIWDAFKMLLENHWYGSEFQTNIERSLNRNTFFWKACLKNLMRDRMSDRQRRRFFALIFQYLNDMMIISGYERLNFMFRDLTSLVFKSGSVVEYFWAMYSKRSQTIQECVPEISEASSIYYRSSVFFVEFLTSCSFFLI